MSVVPNSTVFNPDYISILDIRSSRLQHTFNTCLTHIYQTTDTKNDGKTTVKFDEPPTKFVYKTALNSSRELFELTSIAARNQFAFLHNSEETNRLKGLYDDCIVKIYKEISTEGQTELLKLCSVTDRARKTESYDPTIVNAFRDEMIEIIQKTQASVRGLMVTWQT